MLLATIRALLAMIAMTATLCDRAPVRGSRTPREARAISITDNPNASHTFWPMTMIEISRYLYKEERR